jgi:hypothetical protein
MAKVKTRPNRIVIDLNTRRTMPLLEVTFDFSEKIRGIFVWKATVINPRTKMEMVTFAHRSVTLANRMVTRWVKARKYVKIADGKSFSTGVYAWQGDALLGLKR